MYALSYEFAEGGHCVHLFKEFPTTDKIREAVFYPKLDKRTKNSRKLKGIFADPFWETYLSLAKEALESYYVAPYVVPWKVSDTIFRITKEEPK